VEQERREYCQLQREFCEKAFSEIKETLVDHGKRVGSMEKILENGIRHRLKRVEMTVYSVLAVILSAAIAIIMRG
jgi:DNA-binding TFAR19-related protein (PDSD5 family)